MTGKTGKDSKSTGRRKRGKMEPCPPAPYEPLKTEIWGDVSPEFRSQLRAIMDLPTDGEGGGKFGQLVSNVLKIQEMRANTMGQKSSGKKSKNKNRRDENG